MSVTIEISKGGLVKRNSSGQVDFVSPLPCPFNYGSVDGVLADDGDPLDAVVLGPKIGRGEVVRVTAWAWVDFVDADLADPKLVCTHNDAPPSPGQLFTVRGFFRLYARCKWVLNRMRRKRGSTRYGGVHQ